MKKWGASVMAAVLSGMLLAYIFSLNSKLRILEAHVRALETAPKQDWFAENASNNPSYENWRKNAFADCLELAEDARNRVIELNATPLNPWWRST